MPSSPLSDADHARIKRMIDDQPELIVAAAIRSNGVIITVERPGRHGECMNFLAWLKLDYMDQGFLTNRGRFVTRLEAAEIARAAGQAEADPVCRGMLYSEDVWNDWDVSPIGPIDPRTIFG